MLTDTQQPALATAAPVAADCNRDKKDKGENHQASGNGQEKKDKGDKSGRPDSPGNSGNPPGKNK